MECGTQKMVPGRLDQACSGFESKVWLNMQRCRMSNKPEVQTSY